MNRLVLAVAALVLFATPVFSADRPAPSAASRPRSPEMSTAGTVVEISDSLLKVERSLKGEVEIMEFVLEKPLAGITVGDQIKVSYREKGGRNVLLRTVPAKKTAIQKQKKADPRPAAGEGVERQNKPLR